MLALEYVLLALFLAAPAGIAIAYLVLQGKLAPSFWAKTAYVYLSVQVVAVLIALLYAGYGSPIFTIDLFSPGEGDFELSLSLSQERLKWILALTGTILCFVRKIHLLYLEREEKGLEKFIFIFSAYWCALMAILMDKIWLSFLLAEMVLFFLHAFATTETEEKFRTKDPGYVMRNVIFFGISLILTLMSLLKISAFGPTLAILMSAYFVVILATRSELKTWTQSITLFFILYLTLFILHRVVALGALIESYQLYFWLTSSAALLFAIKALFSNTIKGTYQWVAGANMLWAAAVAVVAQIAGTDSVEVFILITISAMAVIGFLLSSRLADHGGSARIWLLIPGLILLQYLSLGMPLSPLSSAALQSQRVLGNGFAFIFCLIAFIATGSLAKLLPIIMAKKSSKSSQLDVSLDYFTTYPAAVAWLIAITCLYALARVWSPTFGEEDIYLKAIVPVVIFLFALITGFLLGRNPKFLAYLDSRAANTNDRTVKIQSVLLETCQVIVSYPGYFIDRSGRYLTNIRDRMGEFFHGIVFSKTEFSLGKELLGYARSFSFFVRAVHTGEIRLYLFLIEILIAAAVIAAWGSA